MNTPASKKLDIVIPAFRMHTQSFLNVLDGITEEDALKRIDGKTNHIVWMAGNLVNCRYGMAWVLGLREEDPYSDLFFQGKTLSPEYNYPSLQALKESFHRISALLYEQLLQAPDELLDSAFQFGMNVPFVPATVLSFMGMCIGREDYLCGQIGLMRKLLGYEGMKYDVNTNIPY